MTKLFIRYFVCCCAILLVPFQSALAQNTSNSPAIHSKAQGSFPSKVDVNAFEKLWLNKTNIVLDVRSSKEFSAGHIPGAINADVNRPDFTQKVSSLDKTKTYLVHCAAGVRSARACEKMHDLGFQHLVDLAPGFREWEKAGKPIEK